MLVICNIMVLIFEILYYAMFMKFARKEGKFSRYLLCFTLITFVGLFIKTNGLISYLSLVLMIIYGMKYIVKTKISLYDMLIILIMLFLKLIIELPFIIVLYKMLNVNQFIVTIIFDIVKVVLLLSLKNKMNTYYLKMKRLWDNNNFYIRYIFSCSTFIYVIITVILLVKLIWEV